MSFQVKAGAEFRRSIRRLSKKYRSLPDDVAEVVKKLLSAPQLGTPIGHNCYKIRVAIASKNKGKSGGARIITYVRIMGETVILLAIYDKAELANISEQQVLELLARLEE